MRRNHKIALGCVLAVLAAGIVAFYIWFAGLETPTSVPQPTKIQSQVLQEDQMSTILIPVSGNLRIFEDILNKDVPWRIADINEPEKICLKTKSRLIPDVTCRLSGKVDRGQIRLAGSGQTLKISIPISATIRARNIGGFIKQETANGSMMVVLNARLGLRQDWRPTARIKADYQWARKLGVDVLGQRIDLSSRVDPQIRKAIAQIERRLPQLIRELSARKKAESIWTKGFTSARAKSDPQIWVRFTPQQIGFAGYTVRGRRLVVNLAARARTETFVGTRPEDSKVTPLPDLMETLPPSGINVQVPFYIPYSVFRNPVEKALRLGEFQTVKMEDGTEVQARFNQVEIFGTDGGKLAIGIDLTIQEPIPWLGDVSGTIWIVAKPRLDLANNIIGIADLSVLSRTDSRLFNALVGTISRDEIDQEMIRKISYNFSKDYDEGLRKADNWLEAEPLEGFVFRGELLTANLVRLHVTADGLIVQGRATGDGKMYYAPGEAAELVKKRSQRRTERERKTAGAK